LSSRQGKVAAAAPARRPVSPPPGKAARQETAHPASSPDLIFREIIQGLYKGIYVPGQRLVEVDLTQKWGVSRGTVREALNRLAAEGIVVLSRHRGAAIRVLDHAEMQDILAVLEMMIGMAARLAAQRIGRESNRAKFTESFETLLGFRSRPDSMDLVRARNRFYRTLAAIGGNKELEVLLSRMHVHLLRVQLRALHESLVVERFDDYGRIGDAVLAGDARRAELAARRHVRAMMDILDKVPA
jgi:DNA-binding GntR family transcriptional regulator